MTTCLGANAQGFFDAAAPRDQQKKAVVHLPDKPNKTDANGKKQGEWAKKYPNGRYAYTATFVDDVPVGPVVRYTEKGEKSSEQAFRGDTCYTVTYHENGNPESKGIYIKKLKEGEWLFFNNDGVLITRSFYVNDKLHGKQTLYFATGKESEICYYKNGVLNGEWKCFFPSGKTQLSANYVDGQLDGYYTYLDSSTGTKCVEGMYSHGNCVGEWKLYEDNGKDFRTLHYDKNGKLREKKSEEERIIKLYNKYDKERGNLVDPEHFRENPEEYKP